MTLIDYLNRVHFADNIFEEALWAELDHRHDKQLLILTTAEDLESELGERLKSGIPNQIRTVFCEASGGVPTEAEARRVADFFHQSGCDAILACGRGYVINLAKVVCLLLGHDSPLSRFSEDQGGTIYISSSLPVFVAVPRLQGFVSGFNGLVSVVLDDGRMIDIASRSIVPTVTIGDPSIALAEPAAVQASHCVDAVTLCTEALLSPNYNPPASGMAMDGLKRGLQAVSSVSDHAGLSDHRELMAAGINAALVQQKGLGLAHAVTSTLCSVALGTLDKGAIKRLLLPKILAFYDESHVLSGTAFVDTMGLTNPSEAVKALSRAFGNLPLPASLGEIGVTEAQITECCNRAAHHRALSNTPIRPGAADISKLLHSIF